VGETREDIAIKVNVSVRMDSLDPVVISKPVLILVLTMANATRANVNVK
jgi:hypothetical protein